MTLGVVTAGVALGVTKAIKAKNGRSVGDSTDKNDGPREEFAGPYNPNKTREDLEETHGEENVSSTTNPKKPLQTANSNPDKGIEVIRGADGGKSVRVQYNDPVTGQPTTANIPYNDRGLPVFDDHVKYTTTIDHSVSYKTQMKRATEDLKNAINNGSFDSSQFTARQLQDIQSLEPKISGFTWHHNGDTGNMQLVPTVVHDATKHTGQNALSEDR